MIDCERLTEILLAVAVTPFIVTGVLLLVIFTCSSWENVVCVVSSVIFAAAIMTGLCCRSPD